MKFICKNCKKEFKRKFKKSQPSKYCSKSCASSASNIIKKTNVKELECKIHDFISFSKKYCSISDISKNIKVSKKTICKYFNVYLLNSAHGYYSFKGKFEKEIGLMIYNIFDGFTILQEYSFSKLLSNKGKKLKVDFFIKELNIAIEIDEKSHFNKHLKYWRDSDLIKNKFFRNHTDYNLIRIVEGININFYKKMLLKLKTDNPVPSIKQKCINQVQEAVDELNSIGIQCSFDSNTLVLNGVETDKAQPKCNCGHPAIKNVCDYPDCGANNY